MASKRITHEGGNDERDRQVSGKRRFVHSEQPHTLYLTSVGSNSTNGMAFSEPLLRKVLQEMIPPILEEVIPPILQRYLYPPRCGLLLNQQQVGPSGGRALQLCFMNRLCQKNFTQTWIRADDGSLLQIALCDATIQPRKVKEDASSMRVQICVLKGDFGSNGSEDWTAEHFNANILGPREGKPQLLSGDTVVTLENGVGYVNNIVFTDNSSWTKSGKFRLGVKVCQSTSNGADIKEGRSEPSRVKDRRGETYEKRDRPSLNDEVWRLRGIGKNGSRKLSSDGIETVKDLLRLYTTNEASLQQIMGKTPGRSWDTTIEHAKACEKDDNERYIYHGVEAEQSVSLVLNCIYEVKEVSFDDQNFRSLKSLNSEEERLVEKVKQQAYSNLKDLKPFEPTPHSMVMTLATAQFGAPVQGLQQFDLPIAQQGPFVNNLTGQHQTSPNLFQPSNSTPSLIDEAAISDQVGSSQLLDQLAEWPAYLDDLQNAQFASCYTPPTILWEQQQYFCNPNPFEDYGAESSNHVHTSSKGRAEKVWRKFRNVFKWFSGIAVQRKAKVYHCQN